jgi:TonB family protein
LVKTYFPNGKTESEIFYVNKIREGAAKFYYENGNIRQEFSYINGKVDGLVKEYYENGKLKLTYNIENGKKEGRVSIFKEDGTFLTDIPYERGKRVVENLPFIEETQDTSIKKTGNPKEENSDYVPPVIAEDSNKTDSVYTNAEVMPEPVGGMSGIYKRLVYPQLAKENKVEGVVKIAAVVNHSGDVIDAKILNDIGYECGESAKITIFYTRFKPGLQRGKPVMARTIIPIEFKLNNSEQSK